MKLIHYAQKKPVLSSQVPSTVNRNLNEKVHIINWKWKFLEISLNNT